ncbi:MAG: hypothetical protein KAI81_01735 [Candidatus Marinimicrobia bacterium]|nr:hypothetical protein [Candidatus Neomarinimicrobiota bacterium]
MLNRVALKLKAKATFLDWVNTQAWVRENGDLTLAMLNSDRPTYLIDEEAMDDIDAWLEKNYDLLLQDELMAWDPDKKNWPGDLSFAYFLSNFEYEISTTVIDTVDEELEEE